MNWLDRHRAKILDAYRETLRSAQVPEGIHVPARTVAPSDAIDVPVKIIGLSRALAIEAHNVAPEGVLQFAPASTALSEPLAGASLTSRAHRPAEFAPETFGVAAFSTFAATVSFRRADGFSSFDFSTEGRRAEGFAAFDVSLDESGREDFTTFELASSRADHDRLKQFDASPARADPAWSDFSASPREVVDWSVGDAASATLDIAFIAALAAENHSPEFNSTLAADRCNRLQWEAPLAGATRPLGLIAPEANSRAHFNEHLSPPATESGSTPIPFFESASTETTPIPFFDSSAVITKALVTLFESASSERTRTVSVPMLTANDVGASKITPVPPFEWEGKNAPVPFIAHECEIHCLPPEALPKASDSIVIPCDAPIAERTGHLEWDVPECDPAEALEWQSPRMELSKRLSWLAPAAGRPGTLPIPRGPWPNPREAFLDEMDWDHVKRSRVWPELFSVEIDDGSLESFEVRCQNLAPEALAARLARVVGIEPKVDHLGTLPMPAAATTRSYERAVQSFVSSVQSEEELCPVAETWPGVIPEAFECESSRSLTQFAEHESEISSVDDWMDWVGGDFGEESDSLAIETEVSTGVQFAIAAELQVHQSDGAIVEWTTEESTVPSDYQAFSSTPGTLAAEPWAPSPSTAVGGLDYSVARAEVRFPLPKVASRVQRVPAWQSELESIDFAFAAPRPDFLTFDYFDTDLIDFPSPARRHEVVLEPGAVGRWWAGRVTPVPKLPPPAGATFAEKLRGLLAPHIHELLSDPEMMLPDRPFAHQVSGIAWLHARPTAILADQVALGKTMQALLAARLLWRDGVVHSILVLCPRTLIPHWQSEIDKWWPQASGAVAGIENNNPRALLARTDDAARIKLCDYESLAAAGSTAPAPHDLLIFDESQHLLDARSPLAIAVRALPAERRWALTGLDIEKHLPLLRSLFSILLPNLATISDPDRLLESVRQHVLRRVTADAAADLPERTVQDVTIDLLPPQRSAYSRAEIDGIQSLRLKGETVTAKQAFEVLTRVRQLCALGPDMTSSAKLERLLADMDEIAAAGGKAVVFVTPVAAPRVGDALAARGHLALHVHDGLAKPRVDAMAADFASDPKWRVLLLPFSGAVTTARNADYVLLFERGWNPVFEERLIQRVCPNPGGKRLFVRRYVCHDTVDQRISRKLAEGRRLFWHLIDESRPAEGLGLSETELFQVLNIRPPARPTALAPPRVVLEHLDAGQFETMVANLYEKQGYRVNYSAGMEGVDLIAERTSARGVERIAVVIRHDLAVVPKANLDQLHAVLLRDRTFTQGDTVTRAGFTADAPAFIRGKKLTLVDRGLLQRQCEKFGVARFVVAPA